MYAFEITDEFAAVAKRLHPKRYKQILLRIFGLHANPRPPDAMMISSETFLVRVGPYTITYSIDDSARRIRLLLLTEASAES